MHISHASKNRGQKAEELVASIFESHGWKSQVSPVVKGGSPDLIVERGAQCFVVEIKALAEGRPDRAIPLLSQAILEAQAHAHALGSGKAQPLAVICVENASPSLISQVGSFADRYAPNIPIGIVSENGLRHFREPILEEMNAEPEEQRRYGASPSNQAVNLFSDLNQWMLKVLLAPEIPLDLLEAPRQKYRNGSEFADAAQVSSMSASRLLQQLRLDGYLDESSQYLALVRRAELFRHWRSAVMRNSPELPMRFLIRGSVQQQVRGLLASLREDACLGLFAAADALQLGHVSGVPPHVYVPKLPRQGVGKWKMLLAVASSEVPDLIVRQALFPKSVFRGAVHRDGVIVSDVIQVWLDVVNHPSRGQEQADLIHRKVLASMIEDKN